MKPELWDEDAEEMAVLLHCEGMSFSKIAEQLSRMKGQPLRSRNSVAGKINRLGLCKKKEKKNVKRNKRKKVQ